MVPQMTNDWTGIFFSTRHSRPLSTVAQTQTLGASKQVRRFNSQSKTRAVAIQLSSVYSWMSAMTASVHSCSLQVH